ncbi:MAG: hypothetical protein GY820_16635 [Gammaproteobacteria bacterium]|nr:hypothetical protein [Gammaproteobacteria bacterium]
MSNHSSEAMLQCQSNEILTLRFRQLLLEMLEEFNQISLRIVTDRSDLRDRDACSLLYPESHLILEIRLLF